VRNSILRPVSNTENSNKETSLKIDYKESKRLFKDLQDFVDKCGKEVMNKKSLEALIKA